MSRPSETALLTVLALVAFASNSILTRLALGAGAMDAATFTTVRLLAGACVLAAIVRAQGGPSPVGRGGGRGLIGPVALFAYAAPFTFAYVRIGAATGALLLFGAVQITMIGWGIATGERPRARSWVGIAAAAAGLVWLMLPVGAPARSDRQRADGRRRAARGASIRSPARRRRTRWPPTRAASSGRSRSRCC